MPADRANRYSSAPALTATIDPLIGSRFFETSVSSLPGLGSQSTKPLEGEVPAKTQDFMNSKKMDFPTSDEARTKFRNYAGKRLTSHQWAVYDFTLTIPRGKVVTYKDVAQMAGGSPRSVGNALRNNPFCPYVPCHRVIASDHFVGGFLGEWGKDHKTGTRCNQKLQLLEQEGVHFTEKGRLMNVETCIWRPSHSTLTSK